MNEKVDIQRRGFNRRDVLKTAGAGLAAAVLPSVPAFAQAPAELTLWSWLPDFQDQVDLFDRQRFDVQQVFAGPAHSFSK